MATSTEDAVLSLHEKANDALHDGNVDEALEIYNKIIEMVPNDEAALSQLMDIYLERDKLKYYLARANVNIAQGKLEHAINDTKKAINLEPESLEANVKLARLYKVSKKNLKAIDQFSRVVDINKYDADAYYELINLYIKEDSPQSAIGVAVNAVSVFKDDSKFSEFFSNTLAKLYLDDENYEKALDVVKDPMLEAKICLQKGDNDVAKEKLDKINPEKLDKEDKPTYYILLAQYLYNKKIYQEALQAIDKYTAAKEPDAVSFQMRALVYEDMNDEFKAEFNWGLCHKVQGKPEEAIVHFGDAHRLDPKNKDAILELINLYKKTGDKFVAAEYWQKIYELDQDEEARKNLVDFYRAQGDSAMVRKYGEGQESDPQPPEEDEGFLNKIIGFFAKK
ncbi:hypothetical protein tpqmel_0179 [Candidatus Gastranaerophilus sp. (ex Termes propinquus)]|nr:hypothetical protein tpqmel_0179 [Candidatus Gastranaerophilus sp. (ex Termes propinquus)]